MKFLTPWATPTPDCRRQPAAVLLAAAILVVFACQGGPTESGDSGSDDPDHLDSLTITSPAPRVGVHGHAMVTAKAWKDDAEAPVSIVWHSLDPLTATVTTSGIVTGFLPGTVKLTAMTRNVADTVDLDVYALLRFRSDLFADLPEGLQMAVGESVQLEVVAVDVHGEPVSGVPPVSWRSSDPAAVSVDASGLATTHVANSSARVTAATLDDAISVLIRVTEVPAGEPASVRIVHGIPGLGTIRFHLSQGSDVSTTDLSLAYGQSSDVPIHSGTLHVTTEGLPPGDPAFGDPSGEFFGLIRPGDHLSLYAAGNAGGGYLQALWPSTSPVPPDSVLVRLVQSSPALVVYLRPDDPGSGLPQLCYFDPGTVSEYFERAAGDFDVIGQDKYDDLQEIGRVATSVAGGSAVTIVLSGVTGKPLSILMFIDR